MRVVSPKICGERFDIGRQAEELSNISRLYQRSLREGVREVGMTGSEELQVVCGHLRRC